MLLLDVRQAFKEANVIVGRNGMSVFFPPRSAKIYRNTTRLLKDKDVFARLAKNAERIIIRIGVNGFVISFMNNEDNLDVLEQYEEFQQPVTWEMVKAGIKPKNEIAAYKARKYFEQADLSTPKKAIDSMTSYFYKLLSECEQEPIDMSKWNVIKKNAGILSKYIGDATLDEFEETMELEMESGTEEFTIDLFGLPKRLFAEMVECSEEINIEYSCGDKNAFASIMFVV